MSGPDRFPDPDIDLRRQIIARDNHIKAQDAVIQALRTERKISDALLAVLAVTFVLVVLMWTLR